MTESIDMIQAVGEPTFLQKLTSTARAHDSWLCVGLDPDPRLMPSALVRGAAREWVPAFLRAIVAATSDLVCCYKPNLAFFESFGAEGFGILREALDAVPAGIPLMADAKRADIGSSSEAYARAIFDELGFDALTVNPYLGGDALAPFFAVPGKGVFVLVRTSNPGAGEFQELLVPTGEAGQLPLYLAVTRRALTWDQHGTLGLVAGATAPTAVAAVRQMAPDVPILLPGVGAQAGDLEASVVAAVDAQGERAIVNASRGVLYASAGADWQEAAHQAAEDLRAAINAARGTPTAPQNTP
jgi:orotidine-5'-phosphate decarboxylase